MNKQILKEENLSSKKIKVLGLGGCGCNSISRLSALGLVDVELIAANTDAFTLTKCGADRTILLGRNITDGHGAGGDPQTGRNAAEESFKDIIDSIQGADLLFLTAGLGGGTGSGAIEIAARIAASLNILTISIVTLPFSFEAERRKNTAFAATINLHPYTNTLITIPNDRLMGIAAANTPIKTSLGMTDDILIKGIRGITEILNNQGLINIDFSHISKLMRLNGGTYISIGFGSGKNRVANAIQDALSHPLLEPAPINQAQGIVIKLTGDILIDEIDHAVEYLNEHAPEEIEILPVIEQKDFGNDQIMIALMLTGMGATPLSYPNKIEKNPVKFTQQEKVSKITEDDLVFSNPFEDFKDELEVPAFIRKGYNLSN